MEVQDLSNASFQTTEVTLATKRNSVQGEEGVTQSAAILSNAGVELSAPEIDLELLESVNNALAQVNVGVAFEVDSKTQSSVLKVVDKETEKVIKQYPSEESLKVIEHLQNYLNSVQKSGLTANQSLTGALFSEII